MIFSDAVFGYKTFIILHNHYFPMILAFTRDDYPKSIKEELDKYYT